MEKTRVRSNAAVIFDIDGCVSDDRWRRDRIVPDGSLPEHYEQYHVDCDADCPMDEGARLLREHVAAGDFIIFATGRPFKYAEKTSNWIKTHFSIKPNEDFILLMRQNEDGRKSVTVKTEMAVHIKQLLMSKNIILKAAYDDNHDILQMYREFGFSAMLLNDMGTPAKEPMQVTADAIDAMMNRFGSERVAEILQSALDTYKERQNQYGPNDEMNGKIMEILFPLGISLRSAADFRMWHMVNHVVGKLTRFTSSGMHHHDSIHDLIVYAAFVELLADSHDIKSAFE